MRKNTHNKAGEDKKISIGIAVFVCMLLFSIPIISDLLKGMRGSPYDLTYAESGSTMSGTTMSGSLIGTGSGVQLSSSGSTIQLTSSGGTLIVEEVVEVPELEPEEDTAQPEEDEVVLLEWQQQLLENAEIQKLITDLQLSLLKSKDAKEVYGVYKQVLFLLYQSAQGREQQLSRIDALYQDRKVMEKIINDGQLEELTNKGVEIELLREVATGRVSQVEVKNYTTKIQQGNPMGEALKSEIQEVLSALLPVLGVDSDITVQTTFEQTADVALVLDQYYFLEDELYMSFKEYIANIPVLNGGLTMVVHTSGQGLHIENNLYGKTESFDTVNFSVEEAKSQVKQQYLWNEEQDLVQYLEDGYWKTEEGLLQEVYVLQIEKKFPHAKAKYFISKSTGEILSVQNLLLFEGETNLYQLLVPYKENSKADPSKFSPLKEVMLKVLPDDKETTTTHLGIVPLGEEDIQANLKSQYVHVKKWNHQEIDISNSYQDGEWSTDLIFDQYQALYGSETGTGSTLSGSGSVLNGSGAVIPENGGLLYKLVKWFEDQISIHATNVYTHMHAFFTSLEQRNLLPSHIGTQEVIVHGDNTVGLLGQCGVYYDTVSKMIYFGNEVCSGEEYALSRDIILHEAAHGLLHYLWPVSGISTEEQALMEGFADYLVASFTDDSEIGEETLPFIRNVENTLKYTTTNNEDIVVGTHWMDDLHQNAMIIAGVFWDIRKQLGAELTDQIVLHTAAYRPYSVADLFKKVQLVAKNYDNTVQQVTTEAFEQRGMFLPYQVEVTTEAGATSDPTSEVVLNHEEILSSTSQEIQQTGNNYNTSISTSSGATLESNSVILFQEEGETFGDMLLNVQTYLDDPFHSLLLTWDVADLAQSTYRLYRSNDATITTADTQLLEITTTLGEYVDTLLSPATTYYYAIRREYQGEQEWSDTVSSSTGSIPSLPKLLVPKEGALTSTFPVFQFEVPSVGDSQTVRYELVVSKDSEQQEIVLHYHSGEVPKGKNAYFMKQNIKNGYFTVGGEKVTLDPGKYYVVLRSQHTDGYFSEWTEPTSFVVGDRKVKTTGLDRLNFLSATSGIDMIYREPTRIYVEMYEPEMTFNLGTQSPLQQTGSGGLITGWDGTQGFGFAFRWSENGGKTWVYDADDSEIEWERLPEKLHYRTLGDMTAPTKILVTSNDTEFKKKEVILELRFRINAFISNIGQYTTQLIISPELEPLTDVFKDSTNE